MKGDLTRGSVLKQIFFFSLPYLVGNLFQQFYNVVDMVVVGHFAGHTAYAAVGAAGSIVWFLVGSIQMLTAGFSTVVASKFGANDYDGLRKAFASSLKLSLILSAVLTPLALFFARPVLEIMRTPSNIIDRTYSYVVCIFAATVITMIFNLLSNLIRALGDSKTPLYFLVASCVINIILDIIFVAALNLETLGVGLATVFAQFCSVIMCIVYIVRRQKILHLRREDFKTDISLTSRLLAIGVPMALQNMIIATGSIIVQIATNGFGTDFVAAQATGAKVETFVTMPLLSIGTALTVFVAQNNGAGKYRRVSSGIKTAIGFGFIWWIISSVLLIPFGHLIVRLLAGADMPPEAVENAYRYIITNSVFSCVVSILIVIKNALQALERGIFPLLSGFLEIIGRVGIAVLVMSLVSASTVDYQTGYNILCFSNPAAWFFAMIAVVPDFVVSMLRLGKKIRKQKNIG